VTNLILVLIPFLPSLLSFRSYYRRHVYKLFLSLYFPKIVPEESLSELKHDPPPETECGKASFAYSGRAYLRLQLVHLLLRLKQQQLRFEDGNEKCHENIPM
jgi:hypothetical protein